MLCQLPKELRHQDLCNRFKTLNCKRLCKRKYRYTQMCNCCPLRKPKCISGSNNNNLLHNKCPLCNPRCNNNINSNQLRNRRCKMHFNKLYNNGLCVIEWPHLCPQYRR